MRLEPYCRPWKLGVAIERAKLNERFQRTMRARRWQEAHDTFFERCRDMRDADVIEALNRGEVFGKAVILADERKFFRNPDGTWRASTSNR